MTGKKLQKTAKNCDAVQAAAIGDRSWTLGSFAREQPRESELDASPEQRMEIYS